MGRSGTSWKVSKRLGRECQLERDDKIWHGKSVFESRGGEIDTASQTGRDMVSG